MWEHFCVVIWGQGITLQTMNFEIQNTKVTFKIVCNVLKVYTRPTSASDFLNF
jgi:hypothetical protein